MCSYAYLENVVDNVKFHRGLRSNKVIHPTSIKIDQSQGTADNDGALEQIGFVEMG